MVRFTARRDRERKFTYFPLQSEEGMNILKESKFDLKNYDSFVYVRFGKVYIKSTAGLKILLDLGGSWKLCYGLIIFPRFIRDFVYDVIAKYRYKIWGRNDNYC